MGINKYFVARLNIHPGGQFFVRFFGSIRIVFAVDLVEFSRRENEGKIYLDESNNVEQGPQKNN